ncbi:MAG TPA: ATP-binding protein, partial [Casimicrobiaceae bacterium]|nr:ATP-binding protein [Casimicrobiaceae bacterium]
DRRVLEVLREPLESGVIHISRAARQSTFPAEFQLVSAMNPCPCGWLGHASGRCRCALDKIARYRGRVSGSLLDRIDLGVEVPALASEAVALGAIAGDGSPERAPTSAAVRTEVTAARNRQLARQGKPNARLLPREIEANCRPDSAGAALLGSAMARLSLSARAYHRILKVARTIADLAGEDAIAAPFVAEAVGYRRFERM